MLEESLQSKARLKNLQKLLLSRALYIHFWSLKTWDQGTVADLRDHVSQVQYNYVTFLASHLPIFWIRYSVYVCVWWKGEVQLFLEIFQFKNDFCKTQEWLFRNACAFFTSDERFQTLREKCFVSCGIENVCWLRVILVGILTKAK